MGAKTPQVKAPSFMLRKNKNNPNWQGGRIELICFQCDKRFKTWPSRIKAGKKFCSRKCQGLWYSKHQIREKAGGWRGGKKEKKCERCGKKITVYPSDFVRKKYCSKKCYVLSQKGKSVFPKGKSYEEVYGKKKAKEIKKKIGIKSKGRQARLGIPFTPEQLRKVLHFRSPNKTELELNRILKTNFPREWKFVGNGKVIIEGKNPDFININGKKLIIEMFGKHWHEEEDVGKREKLFAKYGYKTLVIWDYELKKEVEVVQKVKQFYRE